MEGVQLYKPLPKKHHLFKQIWACRADYLFMLPFLVLFFVFTVLVCAIDMPGAPWWVWLIMIGVLGFFAVVFHLVWRRMLDSTRKEFAFPDNQKEAMRK